MIQDDEGDGLLRSYRFKGAMGKSLLYPPPHNAKYIVPSKKNKNICIMDSLVSHRPIRAPCDTVEFDDINNDVLGFPAPVPVPESAPATSAIHLNFQPSNKMVLHRVSGLDERSKDVGVPYLTLPALEGISSRNKWFQKSPNISRIFTRQKDPITTTLFASSLTSKP
jgi:hypothetical protein